MFRRYCCKFIWFLLSFLVNNCWLNFAPLYRFRRLTGRSEVAVSAQDYKFYSPRHKYRRVAANSVSSISSLNVSGIVIFSSICDPSLYGNIFCKCILQVIFYMIPYIMAVALVLSNWCQSSCQSFFLHFVNNNDWYIKCN